MEKNEAIEKYIQIGNITASNLEGCDMKSLYDAYCRWLPREYRRQGWVNHLQFTHYMCDRFNMYQYEEWINGHSHNVYAPYSWKSRQLKYAK